jgi:ABC-type multidrug transport system fused ATPase/permease subunit
MEKGRLIEEGTHMELMNNPESVYKHLFLMQFKDPFKRKLPDLNG